MRQGRVKSRGTYIRRKEALLLYVSRLGDESFERPVLEAAVSAFLKGYAAKFGVPE